MNLLVLSDTHIPIACSKLPPEIIALVKENDICLHAGDYIQYEVVETLSKITTFYGVHGNMDDEKIKQRLPARRIITIEKVTIGLVHGCGSSQGIIDTVKGIFQKEYDSINIFVFGHSHVAANIERDGKIFFNPGSPTEKVFSPANSYGILKIQGTKVVRKVVKIG